MRAREIMTQRPACASTRTRRSRMRRESWHGHDFGAMPICGSDDRLKGMLTDRDVLTKGSRSVATSMRRGSRTSQKGSQ